MARSNRTRFVPENATMQEIPAAAVVVYTYDSRKGPAFISYKGRKVASHRHNAYPTPAGRDAALADYIKAETKAQGEIDARKSQPHGLAVGDVLRHSSGYEQTTVIFYQVTRVPSPKSATVRRINHTETSDGPTSMTGTRSPCVGDFLPNAREITLRASGADALGSYSGKHGYLDKWNGKPCRVSSYG